MEKFEYYVGNVKWVKCKNHEIPLGAILAGQEADGRMLYVGRTEHDGCLITGKVGKHLSQGICIPYYGKEIELSEYEILLLLFLVSSVSGLIYGIESKMPYSRELLVCDQWVLFIGYSKFIAGN